MRARLTGISVTVLGAAAGFALMVIYSAAGVSSTWDLTPTAHNYLPMVIVQPTPTPTATPKPTATPSPVLRDGYYVADLSQDSEYAQGEIWFTIDNDGTRAEDAGFLFQAYYYVCPWVGYSWYGAVAVDNGTFTFIDVEDRFYVARLSCTAISRTQARCKAYYPNVDVDMCSMAEGMASRQ